MKFKNQKSGFVGLLVLIVIVALSAGGGVYVYQKQKIKTQADGNYNYPATSTSKVEANVNTSTKIIPPDTNTVVTSEIVDPLYSIYKNNEIGFETSVSTKLLKPTLQPKAKQPVIVFKYPQQKYGGRAWDGEIIVFKILSAQTNCKREADQGTFINSNGVKVEESHLGDAGVSFKSYKMTTNNTSYCVESHTWQGADIPVVGMTEAQAIVQRDKIDVEFYAILNRFISNFKSI